VEHKRTAGRVVADVSSRERKAKVATKKDDKGNKKEAREKESTLFTTPDDGEDFEHEVTTELHYITIQPGRSITGDFVELRPMQNRIENKEELRPVLLVQGQSVILPAHTQLVTAFGKIKTGATVKVACVERVAITGGRTAWNYRISTMALPF